LLPKTPKPHKEYLIVINMMRKTNTAFALQDITNLTS